MPQVCNNSISWSPFLWPKLTCLWYLREYNQHPKNTKIGHLPIRNMSKQELREITIKVTIEYK